MALVYDADVQREAEMMLLGIIFLFPDEREEITRLNLITPQEFSDYKSSGINSRLFQAIIEVEHPDYVSTYNHLVQKGQAEGINFAIINHYVSQAMPFLPEEAKHYAKIIRQHNIALDPQFYLEHPELIQKTPRKKVDM